MIPETPKSGDRILNWANQVNKWMRANTLKNVIGGKLRSSPNGQTIEIGKSTLQKTKIPKHPFQATANGDDTLTINAGSVLSWVSDTSGGFINEPFYASPRVYNGGTVTITTTGYVYLVIPSGLTEVMGNDGLSLLTCQVYRSASDLSAANEPTKSSGNLYIPICDVTLTDGVATIGRQYLHENPLLQLNVTYNDSP